MLFYQTDSQPVEILPTHSAAYVRRARVVFMPNMLGRLFGVRPHVEQYIQAGRADGGKWYTFPEFREVGRETRNELERLARKLDWVNT